MISDRSRLSRRDALGVAAAVGASACGRMPHALQASGGSGDPRLKPLDDALSELLSETGVPGVSAAVARNNRLVYERGLGLADRDRAVPVEAGSLFRIASLSKPITAVAILQLVDRELVRLDQTVLEVLDLPAPADKRWERITIQQLLQHTAGFDRGASFDPMFRSPEICEHLNSAPPAMPEQIIRYMLERPLDFEPGEKYSYSNFGYSLLGRVIERVSGLPYELSVRRTIARPLGLSRLRMGRTLSPCPGEVRYYDDEEGLASAVMGEIGREVERPYGAWCLEAMDAHGGWLATAGDLVRFAAAFHDLERSGLLSPESCAAMIAPPPGPPGHDEQGNVKEVYYGCGWSVRRVGDDGRVNIWHNGGLPGTSTLLVRRHDGISFAALFNARRPLVPAETDDDDRRREMARRVDPVMHQAINAIEDWPEGIPL